MITDQQLAEYLAARDRAHANQVAWALDAMTLREQRLVREAAVMGYVRGQMSGRAGETRVPHSSVVVAEVVGAALTMPDLYPAHDRMARLGARRAAARRAEETPKL